ncbi:kinase-like domain-containing protein [Glomus cerebriforme]|uniref:Kinase-like domain-containing protein n=1 Tax=Glomus cerebriforme TaxID=658196 RepID=A0A397SGS9_9GLOM|nr:kinase-like domain-containing protein [Glomus cerebriforme]
MEILKKLFKRKPKILWKNLISEEYQVHVSDFDALTKEEEEDAGLVHVKDLEKRKQIYGICGECNEPGTGFWWCQSCIWYWDIENQKWYRITNIKVALKSLDETSTHISTEFLNEIYLCDVTKCYGITQDPDTKNYMMVLDYCNDGNLRNYFTKSETYIDYETKIKKLFEISRGLFDIHLAGKVHKDFHSGNLLFANDFLYISDLGLCQPANNEVRKEGIYGVLPYVEPEVLRGHQYTQSSDIYSFGIVMNEIISEESPYDNIPHDHFLAIKICNGPKISQGVPKLLADLIIKCWDAKAENRPTARELFLILFKWDDDEKWDKNSEIYSQIKECNKIREEKFKNRSNNNNSKNIQTHPQAIYTSRLLNFKNLPEPVNSSDLSSFHLANSTNPISECLDCQLSESALNESDENNIDE